MELERVIEQVHGILGIGGVPFSLAEDKQSFLVGHGSARVFVFFRTWGEAVVISVRAYLLEEVDSSGDRRQKILDRLNALNEEKFFGKLYLTDGGTVVLEYDLLGDELDARELLHGLATVSGLADELDDALSAEFGTGVLAEDIAKRGQGEGSGPVVPA
jgi:hypothetical protein